MKDRAIQLNDTNSLGEIMDLKITVVKDSDNKILSGLTIGNTLEQNKALILLFAPGELKEYPTLGVDLSNALLNDDFLELRHTIRQQFLKDDLTITELNLYSVNNITIKAKY
ncbi:MAG: hypothetical protein HYR91_11065 [Flavobacteriia bacterium]|nr:hypothetical protein [Flavobacteriia bacterium]